MYSLFTNVSLLSKARKHYNHVLADPFIVCFWKWLFLAVSNRFPQLTQSLLLLLTVSCGSKCWGLYLWPTINIGKCINIFFPGSQWTFKLIIDWKTEKWNRAWLNVIAILASAFQKAWTTQQMIYDRSPVHNLLFAKAELQQGVCTLRGDSLEMWALAIMKLHPL